MRPSTHRSAGARLVGGLDAVAALRHGRRVARLSQRDLARRAGVSQSLVARIEARRVDPPVGVMQRLLGLCGMRWELRLVVAGDTKARTRRRQTVVTESVDRLDAAASQRRWAEHAAARETSARLADSHLTVRARRAIVKEARLSTRAAQAAAFAASVAAEDALSADWQRVDALWSLRQLDRHLEHCRIPLAERLPAQLGFTDVEAVHELLEALAASWAFPPVTLTGSTARAVWSHAPRAGPPRALIFAPLRGGVDEARSFLARVGARPLDGADTFDLGGALVRLRPRPALSTSLVRWRPGLPARALPVARPEAALSLGSASDPHAIRAVLQWAQRDGRGRRRAPYHEAVATAVVPWWLG